jgi:hypothetical protein
MQCEHDADTARDAASRCQLVRVQHAVASQWKTSTFRLGTSTPHEAGFPNQFRAYFRALSDLTFFKSRAPHTSQPDLKSTSMVGEDMRRVSADVMAGSLQECVGRGSGCDIDGVADGDDKSCGRARNW